MAVSKVNYGDETIIDLTEDTVSPENLIYGITAHDKAGNKILGILKETEISKTISASSTDEEVPSSKCVYDAIQSEKGIANGVATLDENVKIPVAQIPDDIARTSQIPSLDGYITETELENKGYLTDETDPTVPDWAKQKTKPTYTADEVGAESKGVAETKVSTHNTETTSHNDIRLSIQNLSEKLNALADSDDTTLDQLSEIVVYIKNNKSLIDNVTTSKVSIADIINNLTTNVSNKPLSAAQGVALKALIDDITIPSSLPANGGNADTVDSKHIVVSSSTPTNNDTSIITFVI